MSRGRSGNRIVEQATWIDCRHRIRGSPGLLFPVFGWSRGQPGSSTAAMAGPNSTAVTWPGSAARSHPINPQHGTSMSAPTTSTLLRTPSRPRAERSSPRRSTSAIRAGWRFPGPDRGAFISALQSRGWVASDHRTGRVRMGRPERSTCTALPSMSGSSAGVSRRPDPIPADTGSRSTARASRVRRRWTDVPANGAELLDGLFHGRRRGCGASAGDRAGASELVPPLGLPGGRMSIVSDPQGSSFGLMTLAEG